MLALLVFKYMQVFKGEDDKYISYELQNDFDNPITAVINFSDHNILHTFEFNLDQITDENLRAQI